MNEPVSTNQNIIKAADLLEQIKSVDEMIALHQKKGDAEDVMLLQYHHWRNKFLADFKKVLKDLNINAKDLAA